MVQKLWMTLRVWATLIGIVLGAAGSIAVSIYMVMTSSDSDSDPPFVSDTERDLDCVDIGHEVVIGGADPNGLDGDGDWIGCEGW